MLPSLLSIPLRHLVHDPQAGYPPLENNVGKPMRNKEITRYQYGSMYLKTLALENSLSKELFYGYTGITCSSCRYSSTRPFSRL